MSNLERNVANFCGAAMAGIKPASLAVCGPGEREELLSFSEIFRKKGIRIELLGTKNGKLTYLAFRENKLKDHLALRENAAFLRKFGYPVHNFEGCIDFLKLRLLCECYPHEVGVFLGYPVEDIAGYMNDPGGCIFSGVWKVYARPEEKRALFERYKRCTDCIVKRLLGGKALAEIFR